MDKKDNFYVQGLIDSLVVPNNPLDRFKTLYEIHTSIANELEILGVIAVEPLINALKDKRVEIREFSAVVLGNIGDSHALKPLIIALKDYNPNVRAAAAKALGNLGNVKAVRPLIESTKDKSLKVRYFAAKSLGMIGDLEAVESLIELLEETLIAKKCGLDIEKASKPYIKDNEDYENIAYFEKHYYRYFVEKYRYV